MATKNHQLKVYIEPNLLEDFRAAVKKSGFSLSEVVERMAMLYVNASPLLRVTLMGQLDEAASDVLNAMIASNKDQVTQGGSASGRTPATTSRQEMRAEIIEELKREGGPELAKHLDVMLQGEVIGGAPTATSGEDSGSSRTASPPPRRDPPPRGGRATGRKAERKP